MYQLTYNSTSILRTADKALIPADPANKDYAQYLVWVSEGNTAAAADVPPPRRVNNITPRQARLALTHFGLRSQVEAYVAAASQDVKDTWEFATMINRDDPLIQTAQALLSLTDAQIDALFVYGEGI